MNIQRKRVLFKLADILIGVVAIFLLLDAMLGFTRHREISTAPPQLVTQEANAANLGTSCVGGFSNQRTVAGKTQIASHGTPFNAYQLTFTNTSKDIINIRSVTVILIDGNNHVFARQHVTRLDNSPRLTLDLGQSRQIVETAGIERPVASCEVLNWQP